MATVRTPLLVVLGLVVVGAAGIVVFDRLTPRPPPDVREVVSLPIPDAPPKSLAKAIDRYRSSMGDTNDSPSDGARSLTLWSIRHMTWADLHDVLPQDVPHAMKDSLAVRGSKICVEGHVLAIEANHLDAGTIYESDILDKESASVVHAASVGSSGELVKGTEARFCGIFTGIMSFKNKMGGEGRAPFLVGMFDLPENHAPEPAE